ncbi:MAG TPA: TlpA disulfide reductase family protein [Armatimonadaceae bacterium]|nr:TlpA disulfide reductase family protein [Armatimonadaceae bacterium]
MRITHTTVAAATVAAAALLTLPATAQEASKPAAPATATAAVPLPKSPLPAKKTIQAKAAFTIYNSQTKTYSPLFDVTITADGPDGSARSRYRVDALSLAPNMKGKPTSFYFTDGAKQYEYNALIGKYNIAGPRAKGDRPLSQLASMAGLELIITPGVGPRPGNERTVAAGEIDGKKTVVVTDWEPARMSQDGKSEYRAFTRTHLDAASGLPLRREEGSSVDGTERPNMRLDYSAWTFDAPVAPQTFVWSVPPGAEENTGPKLLAVGSPAPDFSAVTPDGKKVRLSDYKGQIVVLDFWATWCGPCQKSMPHLEKVYQQVKDKGVTVLAVCVWDEKDAYTKWLAGPGKAYTFPTVFDPAGRAEGNIAKSLYKVEGIPTQYIIGKDGKIAGGTVGFNPADSFLETALGKLGVPVAKPAAPVAKAP